MSDAAADPKATAHAALCLTEAPYLKRYRGRFREWRGVGLTTSRLPGPGFNFAAVLRPDAPTLDELLPVAREFFTGCDQGWGVLVEGDAGHPMEAELRGGGWPVNEDEPAYVLPELREHMAHLRAAEPAELSIRRATTEADEAAFHRVTAEAFQATPEAAAAFRPDVGYLANPDLALFLGSVDGVDVTGAGFSVSEPTAVVWGVATVPAFRGRTYGAAVTRAALREAAARGCTAAALRSGPLSRPFYERLGFEYVCQHRTYGPPPG